MIVPTKTQSTFESEAACEPISKYLDKRFARQEMQKEMWYRGNVANKDEQKWICHVSSS